MDEAHVTLGKPELGETDPRRGTVEVFVPFEGEVSAPWLEIYKGGPGGTTFSTNMPEIASF